jgi:hypothetical protein
MKKLLTLALGLATLAVLASAAPQGTTPWLNRDLPGGVGDYETASDHLKIQCRFKATGEAITEGVPVGYHCNIKEGGWCKNNDPAGLRCQDMEVMFSWAGGATPWLNRDQPGGVGDYETARDHLKIQCRFKATGNAITDGAPVGYHCNIPDGGWCKNNDPAGLKCEDMEVMFSWAKVAPLTTAGAYYRIDPKDPMAKKACTVKGGVISTQDGQKICAVQTKAVTQLTPFKCPSGTCTYQIPPNAVQLDIELWAGGGGGGPGGYASGNDYGGGGGGGGGFGNYYFESIFPGSDPNTFQPGTFLTLTAGSGGTPGKAATVSAKSSNGGSGSASSVSGQHLSIAVSGGLGGSRGGNASNSSSGVTPSWGNGWGSGGSGGKDAGGGGGGGRGINQCHGADGGAVQSQYQAGAGGIGSLTATHSGCPGYAWGPGIIACVDVSGNQSKGGDGGKGGDNGVQGTQGQNGTCGGGGGGGGGSGSKLKKQDQYNPSRGGGDGGSGGDGGIVIYAFVSDTSFVPGSVTFSSNGTFYVFPGTTKLTIEAWGGGGGGGGGHASQGNGNHTGYGGSGGGAGGYQKNILNIPADIAAGSLLTVQIGAAGSGATGQSIAKPYPYYAPKGSSGGASKVTVPNGSAIVNLINVGGGAGGGGGTESPVNIPGGTGGSGNCTNTGSSAGWGIGGSSGGNACSGGSGGAGAADPGCSSGGRNGDAGDSPGAGGGGGSGGRTCGLFDGRHRGGNGGNGGKGQVKISWQ